MLTGVLRQARRRAAVHAYLEAGWPIAPGAWWDPRAEQYRCRRVGCLTTGTIHAADGLTPRSDASAWNSDPATMLLVTGHGVDVLEIPLGSAPLDPVLSLMLTPGPEALWTSVRPRLLIPARVPAGGGIRPVLPSGLPEGALLHGSGSYVPLPPSHVRTGDVVWMRPPPAVDWQLPELDEVLQLVARRLAPHRPAPSRPAPSTGGLQVTRAVQAASLRSSTPRKA
jgi:hypothetical protein